MNINDTVYHKAGSDPLKIVYLQDASAVCIWTHADKLAASAFLLTDLTATNPKD